MAKRSRTQKHSAQTPTVGDSGVKGKAELRLKEEEEGGGEEEDQKAYVPVMRSDWKAAEPYGLGV